MGFFSKIKEGLKKTNEKFAKKLFFAFKARKLNDEFYEGLEEALITSDAGIGITEKLIEDLKSECFTRKITTVDGAKDSLKELVLDEIDFDITEYSYPLVMLIAGVNGVGKTTSVGKLAKMFKDNGKSVLIAAADTFRAAASEQLQEWGDRSGVKVIRQKEGADPAAVVFDAITSAKAKKTDVILVDTAGRLHNKKNLMDELNKIYRVTNREFPQADVRTYLVLDATTGQNALQQAKTFRKVIEADGIILTKLDGTAKGGVVIALGYEINLPVIYAGVGEGIDDLIPFSPKEFVDAIFD